MKTIKLFFVAVVVFVTLSVNSWGQESGSGKNDYGIVAGQILDPETGKPVMEKFDILFFDTTYQGEYPNPTVYPIEDVRNASIIERPNFGYSLRTDKNGYFKRKFVPGTYVIFIAPVEDKSSMYCSEVNPLDPKMSQEEKKQQTFKVQVSKGKITKFAKKAFIGGKIKANIIDKNGNRIDPKTIFKPETVVSIEAIRSDLTSSYPIYFINKGQFELSPNLLPRKYSVELIISWDIYGEIYRIKNVAVINKETTEINFVIDLDAPNLKGVLLNN